jgi:hypothetical protein
MRDRRAIAAPIAPALTTPAQRRDPYRSSKPVGRSSVFDSIAAPCEAFAASCSSQRGDAGADVGPGGRCSARGEARPPSARPGGRRARARRRPAPGCRRRRPGARRSSPGARRPAAEAQRLAGALVKEPGHAKESVGAGGRVPRPRPSAARRLARRLASARSSVRRRGAPERSIAAAPTLGPLVDDWLLSNDAPSAARRRGGERQEVGMGDVWPPGTRTRAGTCPSIGRSHTGLQNR